MSNIQNEGLSEEKTALGGLTGRSLFNRTQDILPLLAVISYALGSIFVDAYYSRIHTPVGSAGLGYVSIIEPAALIFGFVAIAGLLGKSIYDAFRGLVARYGDRARGIVFLAIGAVLTIAGIVTAFQSIHNLPALIAFFVAPLIMSATRTLGSSIFSASKKKNAEPVQVAEIEASDEQIPIATESRQKLQPTAMTNLSVVAAVVMLVVVAIGLHIYGANEADRVMRGDEVNLSWFWIPIPSITATPVSIQMSLTDASPNLFDHTPCFLEIGDNSGNVLLYDVSTQSSLSVPSSSIVVTSLREDNLCRDESLQK